jgi:hypothetical protein
MVMGIIRLVIALVIVGVILWAVNSYIPMDGKLKQILNVVVVFAAILWPLTVFGVLPMGSLRMASIGR